MAKRKVYKVTAKYEFEMVGTSKEDVDINLQTLLDSLVECHSNIHTGLPDDYPEDFTGEYPKKISVKIKLAKQNQE